MMTPDPRAQLAFTMLTALTSQNEPRSQKDPPSAIDQDRLRKEQEQRSMEALTRALLDPCTTVQEAVLDSLLQRTITDSPSLEKKKKSSGS